MTGANGFLGRYISRAWQEQGSDVISLGRSPHSNNIVCDLAEGSPDLKDLTIDAIVHCAGKAHTVPKTEAESAEFFRVNVEGTKNLLRSLEETKQLPTQFVFMSSVAVYGKDEGASIDESQPLNGNTPYAESKIQAENVVAEWAVARGITYFNLRLPLVAGSNPPGNLGRMLRHIRKGTYVKVANNSARKSVVVADDVAELTCRLANESGAYNLTDAIDPEFREIENAIAESVGRPIGWQIPRSILKFACRAGDLISVPVNNDLYRKLTSTLTFSSSLAVEKLDWKPRSSLERIREGCLFEVARD